MQDMQTRSRVMLDFPFPGERVFRYQAMQDILHHLVNDPMGAFTQKELAEITDTDVSTVSRSVDLLEQLGVIAIDDGRPSRIRIDHDHLEKPDPILAIPQAEFRNPVHAFVEELQWRVEESDEIESILGTILFGSVARGTADRGSDIDVWIVIEGNRTHGRRIANRVASDTEERSFDGDRYEFEVLVETVESATQYGPKLREIFDEGIVLQRTDALRRIRRAVYEDGTTEGA